ncbi:hypothetical protein [Jiangella mangrovi]|uniref:Uncharacterized protein n=1 Tax=Jiangella mangrovi TaxID=1524084 RepID=A0A7W9GMR0_9ACTN|nr:hypothetical protein [Jiangella mangrovi]MBB5786695.1 hypothetical protein [Jiangella mangrovi]
MASVRHRRRLTAVRLLAVAAPVTAIGLTAAALVLEGPWPRIAAAAGAVAAAVLGAFVLRLERKLRVEVASVRAEQAAEYSEAHARYSEEHREFTDHMVGLLDVASERIDVMRGKLDLLEAEIAAARSARPGASTPSVELARLAEGAEWNDLWPDLSEAPTVVDLIKWEDKNTELLPEVDRKKKSAPVERQERSA